VGVSVAEAVEVGVIVGEGVIVGVSVSVGVNVSVGVGESVTVGVSVKVGVMVGVGELVGVKVGTAMVAGRPTTRETRNCSTMASRLADRCSDGHQLDRIGAMSGWSKSTVTETRSPGPPPSSAGWQSAGIAALTSDGK
jgi:hypothetical protein